MFGTVGIDLADKSRFIVVGVNLFAAIGVGNGDTAFIVPDVMRFHLRETRPVMNTARQFAFVFPLPKETRTTRQLPFKNHVLIVVAIVFGFTGSILRFNQAVLRVIAVRDQRLEGVPGVFQIVCGNKLLIVDGDDVLAIVSQEQGATGAIVEAFDPAVDVTGDVQPIAIAVADGDQGCAFAVVTEVVEGRSAPGLSQDKFRRVVTDENRCP